MVIVSRPICGVVLKISVKMVAVGVKLPLATGVPLIEVKTSALPNVSSVGSIQVRGTVVGRTSIAADLEESYIIQLLMQ